MSRPVVQPNRATRRAEKRATSRTRKTLAGGLTLAAVALVNGQVLAAEPGDKPEEIEVKGKQEKQDGKVTTLPKLGGDLKDIPQAITVIPKAVLEQQGATTLRDAMRNISGIGLTSGEGGGAQGDGFTLRGYSARNDMYIDGVRDAGSYFRDVFNLESVEVLKGPSSTYFGRGSTGGVINQSSKLPGTDPIRNVQVGGGTGSFLRGSADFNQPITDTIAVRANLMAQHSDKVHRDEVQDNRMGFAPSIAFGLGTSTQFTVSYLFQRENNVQDYGFPFTQGEPVDVDRDTFFGLKDDFEKTEANIVTARLQHEIGDGVRVSNTTRFSRVHRNAVPTTPTVVCNPSNLFCEPGTTTPVSITRSRPHRNTVETILSNQTDLNAEFQTGAIKHNLATGVELSREGFDTFRVNENPVPSGDSLQNPDPDVQPGPPTAPTADSDATATNLGVYLADKIELGKHVDLLIGARWDSFRPNFDDRRATGAIDFDSRDGMLSYRAGLVFRPRSTQSFYISYGTSFNPSAEGLALNANNSALDPEENRILEIGAKADLFEGLLGLQAAVFQIDKTNARTRTSDTNEVQALDGEQRVRGFEIGVSGRVRPGWTLFASYTFLDSEVLESRDFQAVDGPVRGADGLPVLDPNSTTGAFLRRNVFVKGNQLQNVPRHSATLWTTMDLGPGGKWQIGGGPTFVGKRFSNLSNFNEVGHYWRWDATIAYKVSETVELRFNGLNLTDEEYPESIGNRMIPGPGRTFVVTSSFKF